MGCRDIYFCKFKVEQNLLEMMLILVNKAILSMVTYTPCFIMHVEYIIYVHWRAKNKMYVLVGKLFCPGK
jgi:hypothetical protein